MYMKRVASAGLAVALAVGGGVMAGAQQRGGARVQQPEPPPTVPAVPAPRIPLAPAPVRGASVTPALEGWFQNPDGTFTILVGYRNRNQNQTFDVPVGPNNSIEPGGPDYGQPTRFDLGRHYGVFSLTVPKDFGTKRLTYTINVNNQPQTITLGLPSGYQISPFRRNDTGNTPPVVKLDPSGPEYQGPPRGAAKTLSATVGQSITLPLYVTDKGATINQSASPTTPAADGAVTTGRGQRGGITVRWYKHRGPAGETVKFEPASPMLVNDPEPAKLFEKPGDRTGKATTTATFTTAGEYWLRAQISDGSQLDEQCCWSTVLIKVDAQASAGSKGP